MITAAVRAANRRRETIGKTLRECPICGSMHLEYEFLIERVPVCGCQTCGLLFLNPAPENLPGETGHDDFSELNRSEEANADDILSELCTYSGIVSGRVLIVGGNNYLEEAAKRQGLEPVSISPSALEAGSALPESIDLCILFSSLEKMRDPFSALQLVRSLLQPQGAAIVICPTTDSRAAKVFRSSWWEFNRQSRFYFSTDALHNLLIKAGFGDSVIKPDLSPISINYLVSRLNRNGTRSRKHNLLRAVAFLSPFLAKREFRALPSRTRFLVRSKVPSQRAPLLSVIVPVYNERATFTELMEQLANKRIEGVDIEIIIVESNSSDGTREQVQAYASHPRVKLILHDKPMGKGYAVRAGLRAASGDIILFQDADLEYDLNDYDALLAPILRFETNFVLGSRHNDGKNSWKIRKFTDSPGIATIFNFGHLVFLSLFNALYSQRLTDPFTMFKVFRRDCIYGLSFECNRFDFDYEIVIKLLRKGYQPLELPVNYISRSVSEGKKVTMLRDPLTWIRALLKFRKGPIYS